MDREADAVGAGLSDTARNADWASSAAADYSSACGSVMCGGAEGAAGCFASAAEGGAGVVYNEAKEDAEVTDDANDAPATTVVVLKATRSGRGGNAGKHRCKGKPDAIA